MNLKSTSFSHVRFDNRKYPPPPPPRGSSFLLVSFPWIDNRLSGTPVHEALIFEYVFIADLFFLLLL